MPKRNFKKSFTLIEILIAIFILEVGLLALAGFYSNSLQIVKTARNQTLGTNLAEGVLEETLSVSYDNLSVADGTRTKYSENPASPFYNWEKKVDVSYIDDNLVTQISETYMKKVTVTVYWQEKGQEKSLQTASIKSRH